MCRIKQTVVVGEASPQHCKAEASHLSGSASGSPDWCHGQLPGSEVARGGKLAHEKSNTQFPLHPKRLFFSPRLGGHSYRRDPSCLPKHLGHMCHKKTVGLTG